MKVVGENAQTIGREVGNVSPTSIAAIQRALLQVEQQGGDAFFGEPAGTGSVSLAGSAGIALAATGAYCYSMSSRYNMMMRPAIVSVGAADDKAHLMVRRETLEDFFNLEA